MTRKKKPEELLPMGRPPIEYKPEYCNRVRELLNEGASKVEIAYELGVCKNTLDKWMKENPDFLIAFNEGKDLSEGWWTKKGRLNLENKDFNSRLYEINMMNRFGWMKKAQDKENNPELKELLEGLKGIVKKCNE